MPRKRYERKDQSLSSLVSKIKLWPSRTGVLHGIRDIAYRENAMIITTHCGETFVANDSRTSRSCRWLRCRYATKPCKKCGIPAWKLEKYSNTTFH